MVKGTHAVIHLENLKHNIELVRQHIGPDRKICLPVKADGYGHGMIPIARAALRFGCEYLSVARTDELKELREGEIKSPVMVMGHVPLDEVSQLVSLGGEPFAGSSDYLKALEKAVSVQPEKSPLPVHLKIDTGMGRIGCPPPDGLALARQILKSPYLSLKGLCTHFPVSDETDEESRAFTLKQIGDLKELAQAIRDFPEFDPSTELIVHGANSGGVVQHKESLLDMVRPGILLYGYEPLPSPFGVRPLMELSSALVFIKKVSPGQTISYGRTWKAERETWVGTIPIGYGDGYNRHLSNQGKIWIENRIYSQIGRVCMDQIMVDLGPDLKVKLGDSVTLFGPAPCPFSAADLAKQLKTISYEVCCLITKRVPREYVETIL